MTRFPPSQQAGSGLRLSPDWLKVHASSIPRAKQIHAFLLRNHLFHHNHLVSKLLSFLTVSGSGNLDYARKFFSCIESPDMFIWNTMIRGLAKGQNPAESISFYYFMVQSGVSADNFTYPFVLTACARLACLNSGRMFHGKVTKIGLGMDVFVVNSLIGMYSDCGCLEAARDLFDGSPVRDVVSWNIWMAGCVRGGLYREAFDLFDEMVRTKDAEPDNVTMLTLASACTHLRDSDRVKMVHSYVKGRGLDMGVQLGNAFVDAFCKCGDLESAQQVFSEIDARDVFTWTSMISGFANSGKFIEALSLFGQMQSEKIQPDEVAFVCALSACAQMGALDQGKYIHLTIERCKVKQDVVLMTALVDMYAKCGRIDFAFQVFNKMSAKNVFTWNAMIGGLAMHGHGRQALALFEEMKRAGIFPDDVTFIGILSACSHSGLVNEGHNMFVTLQEVCKIEPRMEHYGCIVDLLCRAGLVDDAFAFMEEMPIRPNATLWATLHGACRKGGNFVLAEKIGQRVIELEPDLCGRYVLLSNYYAGVQRWDDALMIRNQMKSKGIEKVAGFSWIELNGVVHQFVAGDKSHYQTEQIYLMVEEMCQRVKLAGHVSGTSEVMFNIEEEEKEHSLHLHSEKLAVAFGLMNTAPGSTIQIVKNLRVCNDCHSFFKVISVVFRRSIVARDRSRFHHFREGSCSCKDFW